MSDEYTFHCLRCAASQTINRVAFKEVAKELLVDRYGWRIRRKGVLCPTCNEARISRRDAIAELTAWTVLSEESE
jgi:hypothetical protein